MGPSSVAQKKLEEKGVFVLPLIYLKLVLHRPRTSSLETRSTYFLGKNSWGALRIGMVWERQKRRKKEFWNSKCIGYEFFSLLTNLFCDPANQTSVQTDNQPRIKRKKEDSPSTSLPSALHWPKTSLKPIPQHIVPTFSNPHLPSTSPNITLHSSTPLPSLPFPFPPNPSNPLSNLLISFLSESKSQSPPSCNFSCSLASSSLGRTESSSSLPRAVTRALQSAIRDSRSSVGSPGRDARCLAAEVVVRRERIVEAIPRRRPTWAA